MNENESKLLIKDKFTSNKKQTLKYKKRIQIISLVVFIVLMIGATLLLMPLIRSMRTAQGMEDLKTSIGQYNIFISALIFVFLQGLQVVVAIVPPIQVVGGLLFGWFWGAVLSFIGAFLGSLVVFMLVKKIGAPLVEASVGEKHLKKFKFLQDERKLTGILMILYLIPAFPKDVLTYIVPLTKMDKKDFFMYVVPCRLPAIILSTVFGSNVGDGNFKIAIVILAIVITIGIIAFFFKDAILNKLKQRKK